MRKYIKNTVAALLTVVIILSSYLPTFSVDQPSSYSTSSNSGERDIVCTSLDGTGAGKYYTGSYTYANLSAQTSSQLFTSLRTLMTSTHKKITSYSECRDLAIKTDCENNDGRIVMIYTSYSGTKGEYANGQGWNREHVWPQSLGGDNTSGGGADLHHIRPSEAKTNSTRGNKKYGDVSGGSTATGNLSGDVGGTSSSGFFEPLDNVKGDVARICLYVYVRWGSDWGADNINKVFQSVDVLLEWCALDPVDTWEMGRNEVVESIQGNRNVFIDYPELAWLIFGKEVPSNMTTPSGIAGNGNVGGGNQGGNEDTPDEGCAHSNTELQNYREASCQSSGYSGDLYCKDCGELLNVGEPISSSGQHKYGDWGLTPDGMSFISYCTVCGLGLNMTVDNILTTLDSDAERILILLALGSSEWSLLDSLAK